MVKVEKKLEQMGLKLPEVSEGSKYWTWGVVQFVVIFVVILE